MQQYDESQNDDVSERIQTCPHPHPKKKSMIFFTENVENTS